MLIILSKYFLNCTNNKHNDGTQAKFPKLDTYAITEYFKKMNDLAKKYKSN